MFQITPEILASGHTFRKDLLAIPRVKLNPLFEFMTPRYGVQGKETVTTLSNSAQLRPYKTAKGATDNTKIDMRTLETYLGDIVEEFDRNILWSSLWGGDIITEKDSQWDIAKKVAMYMGASALENVHNTIWKAKRNATGDKTIDLFDGFETIIEKDITAQKIATAEGNLIAFDTAPTEASIVKMLQDLYFSSHDILQETDAELFIPRNWYNMYNRGYVAEYGSVAYNKEFNKTYLEGSNDKCRIVPMSGMTGDKAILTTKKNMLIGMDQRSEKETVEITRGDNPKALQFFMLLYFGVQLETIDRRSFLVGKVNQG